MNAWVVIKPDDTCVIRIARSEMGQGTLTGLAQLVAEELECDWNKVTTESITAGQNLARKRVWGDMATGGSRGIRTSQDYVRRGGAVARMMLLQAAADEWKVPVGELKRCRRHHHPCGVQPLDQLRQGGGRRRRASPRPIRRASRSRIRANWKIAGKPLQRLDTADKLNGSKVYAIDVKLPGMLTPPSRLARSIGGKLKSYDEAKIASRPGFRRVVKVNDSTVAVVADTWWQAQDRARRIADRLGRGAERIAVQRD